MDEFLASRAKAPDSTGKGDAMKPGYVFHCSADSTFEMYATRERAERMALGEKVIEVDASQFTTWIPQTGTFFRPGTEAHSRLAMLFASHAMADMGIFKD